MLSGSSLPHAGLWAENPLPDANPKPAHLGLISCLPLEPSSSIATKPQCDNNGFNILMLAAHLFKIFLECLRAPIPR